MSYVLEVFSPEDDVLKTIVAVLRTLTGAFADPTADVVEGTCGSDPLSSS